MTTLLQNREHGADAFDPGDNEEDTKDPGDPKCNRPNVVGEDKDYCC